jgi:outer membrane protein TolC
MRLNPKMLGIVVSILVCCFYRVADTAPIKQELELMLKKHNLTRALEADVQGAKSGLRVVRSVWFPKLNYNHKFGREKYEFDTSNIKTDNNIQQETIGFNQLIWDFGATNAAISKANEVLHQAKKKQELLRQNLVLQGIESYINIWLAWKLKTNAEEHVQILTKHVELVQKRVEIGKGYTADLVQVKSQLEGAKGYVAKEHNKWLEANHHFHALFGRNDVVPDELESIISPTKHLPHDMKEVVAEALSNHISLSLAKHSTAEAQYEVKRTKASEWFPQVSLLGDIKRLRNLSGTEGDRVSRSITIFADYEFDFGFKASNTVKVALMKARSLEEQTQHLETQVLENARKSWDNLLSFKKQAKYFKHQVDFGEKFISLAQVELELGRRSLLDVLNGEAILFTARKESITSEVKAVLAAYQVLHAIGKLNLTMVESTNTEKITIRSQTVGASN